MGAPASARVAARTLGTQKTRSPRTAAARVANARNGDPCDRPGGWFASLVIRRAGFAIQASTSHVSDMKAQVPMLTLMHVGWALELFQAVH